MFLLFATLNTQTIEQLICISIKRVQVFVFLSFWENVQNNILLRKTETQKNKKKINIISDTRLTGAKFKLKLIVTRTYVFDCLRYSVFPSQIIFVLIHFILFYFFLNFCLYISSSIHYSRWWWWWWWRARRW